MQEHRRRGNKCLAMVLRNRQFIILVLCKVVVLYCLFIWEYINKI